jgi:aminomethyltransferase
VSDPATPLIRTPLTALHEAAGAKLAPFAGWSMPLQFTGVLAEHQAVRDAVGVFDVSHLGTVWVTGPAATATIDRSFTADARALTDGTSRYALCTAEDGGILDDLLLYRLAAERWLVVPNAANTATVVARLRAVASEVAAEARPEVVEAAAADEPEPAGLAVGTALVDDASTAWAIVAVQGPRSHVTVREALDLDPTSLPYLGVGELPIGPGGPPRAVGHRVVVCRTGYTGEIGTELLVPAEFAAAVWESLTAAGATPCGLGARDTLRLEMGYPLHGSDLGPDVLPAEARSSWAVQLEDAAGEPRRFPGAVALAAAKATPPARRMLGLRSDGRRPLRAGCDVVRDGELVGRTTSGGFAPTLGVGIALASLDRDVELGDRVAVSIRGSEVEVEVVRPPFVDRDPRD